MFLFFLVTISTNSFTQLRFTLHQAPTWYTIDNEVDARFDYFIFYIETIEFLEEEALATYTKELISELNK